MVFSKPNSTAVDLLHQVLLFEIGEIFSDSNLGGVNKFCQLNHGSALLIFEVIGDNVAAFLCQHSLHSFSKGWIYFNTDIVCGYDTAPLRCWGAHTSTNKLISYNQGTIKPLL